MAWLMANLLILGIQTPANELAELYGSPYRLAYLDLNGTALLMGSAIVLGILGALVVVNHFLKDLDPL
jgi:cell division protein FtsX